MQGNGGTMSVDVAARHAVNTLMSGPAAGVKAAAHTALAAGHANVISCDMGGTSFDVGVIVGGAPAVSADKEMGYGRSEEHTSELQSRLHLVCRLLLEKKKR